MARYRHATPMFTSDLDPEKARSLYAAAQANPDSGLTGDLETGFEFWVTHEGVRLVPLRVWVMEDGDGGGTSG